MTPTTRVAAQHSIARLLGVAAVVGPYATLGQTARLVAGAPALAMPASPESAPAGAQPSDAANAAPAAVQATPAPTPSAAQVALYRERLSRSFAQRARNLLQGSQIYLGMLESSKALLGLSTELAPDNPFIWRLALDLATTMEDGDPAAAELASTALRRLNQLDPDNELVRLRVLLDAIEKRQTAEARIEAYRSLLEPDAIARIGNVVASRIAFDHAVLLRRTGDLEGFERELLRAIDLDPAFPDAIELAAGYFRMRAPTRAIEAQALRMAVIANPLRTPAALGLASLCLESGAYSVAADILKIEAKVLDAPRPDPVLDAVLTDLCVALWGAGRTAEAFEAIALRQQSLDQTLLDELDRQNAVLSPAERNEIRMPIAPSLGTAVAAMANSLGGADAAIGVKNAAVSYQTTIEGIERLGREATSDEARENAEKQAAAQRLEGAWSLLWLNGDLPQAKRWIAEAVDRAPISDDAKARFDGMIAFREGKTAEARTLLEPIAERDLAGGVGLAMVLEAEGDLRGAGRRYLAAARKSPQSAMGVWSRDRLWKLLGQQPSVIEGAEEVAAAAALPPAFLELMRDGSRKVLVRVRPRALELRPWDPLLFDIELVNLSDWSLAISREGPIADTMTINASVTVPGRTPGPPPFALVALDRSLTIPARGTIVIPVDASLTDASATLRDDPISGAFLSLQGIMNWRTTATGLEAGPLGSEGDSPLVHVQGEVLTAEWVKDRLAALADPAQLPDPETIAMLAHAHRKVDRDPTDVLPGVAEALAGSGTVLADAARRLWPEARAWLVYAAPHGRGVANDAASGEADNAANEGVVPGLEPLMQALSEDSEFFPRLAWISVRSLRPEDAVLAQTLELKDERLASFAKSCRAWLIDLQEERRRELNLR